ncbi:TPA: hypothetical protein DCZ15_00840 [Candidatus Falkowbacteria bacterium]|nr:MAG: hypothetical protein UV95_C0003G0029 [Candidatus Falkowbacteria bacterium GW2011_GWF2_43_32]HBA36401.1 hypothetical protein [Candidatus Falkowbacteria bacterium]
MTRKLIVIIVLLAAAVNVNAQARYNRMNIEIEENYHFFNNPAFGNGNVIVVSGEWLPGFNKPKGIFGIINSDVDKINLGVYYSSTIRSWEDKRPTLSTGFNVNDFQQESFGVAALMNITGLQTIGDITVLAKTGPNNFNGNIVNKMIYNIYLDSVLAESQTKNYSENLKNFGWNFQTKITRFNRNTIWAFRNSLAVEYLAVITSEIKRYENYALIENSQNRKGRFAIMAESNVTDINLNDKIGLDPRVKIGFVKGETYNFGLADNDGQMILGLGLSLIPRTDRSNDIINDAINLYYEWHSGGERAGGQLSVKCNLFSLGRLL